MRVELEVGSVVGNRVRGGCVRVESEVGLVVGNRVRHGCVSRVRGTWWGQVQLVWVGDWGCVYIYIIMF